jgi:hypothetical protein
MRLEPSGDTNASFETAQVLPQHLECVPRMLRSPARGISARRSSTSFAFSQLEIDDLIIEDANVFVFGGKEHQPAIAPLTMPKRGAASSRRLVPTAAERLAAPSEAKRMAALLLLPAIW